MQYVKLDGDVGILGNGAGLVMSTLDVVAQAGGEPANFCDVGGGADAEKISDGPRHRHLQPEQVESVLFNIFGGITRGDEVARGLLSAHRADRASGCRLWSAWTGRTPRRGAEILAENTPAQRAHRRDHARGRPQGRGAGARLAQDGSRK